MDERKGENYIPVGINAGGIKKNICLPTYPNFSDRVGSGETKIFLNVALLQMLRFSRRVKYYDTVYRRICYGFQTKTKEMYEVSFLETSSVLDETGIFMNVSIGGADGGPDEEMMTPDSPVEETSGSSKLVKPDLTPAVYCS